MYKLLLNLTFVSMFANIIICSAVKKPPKVVMAKKRAIICFIPFSNIDNNTDIEWLRASISPALQRFMTERFEFISQQDCMLMDAIKSKALYKKIPAGTAAFKKMAMATTSDYIITGYYKKEADEVRFVVDVFRNKGNSLAESIIVKVPLTNKLFNAVDDLSKKLVKVIGKIAKGKPGDGEIKIKTRKESSKRVYTLRKGETVFLGEYLASFRRRKLSSTFITIYKNNYYVIIDGRRIGPWDRPSYVNVASNGKSIVIRLRRNKKSSFIDNSGKIHGPFESLDTIKFNSDGSKVYYSYAKNKKKYLSTPTNTLGPFETLYTWNLQINEKGDWVVSAKKKNGNWTLLYNGKERGSFKKILRFILSEDGGIIYAVSNNRSQDVYQDNKLILSAFSIIDIKQLQSGKIVIIYKNNAGNFIRVDKNNYGPFNSISKYTFKSAGEKWVINVKKNNQDGFLLNGSFTKAQNAIVNLSEKGRVTYTYKNNSGYFLKTPDKTYGPHEYLVFIDHTGNGEIFQYLLNKKYYLVTPSDKLGPFDSYLFPVTHSNGHWGVFGRKDGKYSWYMAGKKQGPYDNICGEDLDEKGNYVICVVLGKNKIIYYNGRKIGSYNVVEKLRLVEGRPVFNAAFGNKSTVVFNSQEHGESTFNVHYYPDEKEYNFVWFKIKGNGEIHQVTY